jgi:hypothetical protein
MGMLNITEEETKKESNSKEEADLFKLTRNSLSFFTPALHVAGSGLYITESKIRITHQFISDNHTPPPDRKA